MEQKETRLQFEATKRISKKKMKKAWASITSRPFPYGKIHAYVLDRDEWDRVVEILKQCTESVTFFEYGKQVEIDNSTDALITIITLPDETKRWLILMRKTGFYTVDENLRHELKHIANGNLPIPDTAAL